jgi:predicted DNA-binding protein
MKRNYMNAGSAEGPTKEGIRLGKADGGRQVRGDHCLNVFVSHDLKSSLKQLASKYDRTTADIVRAVLRIGIPMMEGLSKSEEIMVREYVQLFRKLRQVKALKEI